MCVCVCVCVMFAHACMIIHVYKECGYKISSFCVQVLMYGILTFAKVVSIIIIFITIQTTQNVNSIHFLGLH